MRNVPLYGMYVVRESGQSLRMAVKKTKAEFMLPTTQFITNSIRVDFYFQCDLKSILSMKSW